MYYQFRMLILHVNFDHKFCELRIKPLDVHKSCPIHSCYFLSYTRLSILKIILWLSSVQLTIEAIEKYTWDGGFPADLDRFDEHDVK